MGLLFWLPLVLPVLAVGTFFYLNRLRRDHFPLAGELALWLAPIALLLGLTWWLVRAGLTRDEEYLNGWATHLRYVEEEWRTETYTTTDANGNVTTHTRLVYDPPSWSLHDSTGGSLSIGRADYLRIARSWGHAHPPDGGSSGRDHWLKWNDDRTAGIPVTRHHHYSNRTLASRSVFGFRELSAEEKEGLHPWPQMVSSTHAPMLLGYRGADAATIDRKLAELNADLGPTKQARVHVLVWYGAGVEVAERQRELWRGGKKNELNVCLGLSETGEVEWCRCFSWTEREDLKAEVADWPAAGKPLDWDRFLGFLRAQLENKWERKRFRDFGYLAVDMPGWSVLLAWLLGLLGTGGMALWRVDWESWRSSRASPARRRS